MKKLIVTLFAGLLTFAAFEVYAQTKAPKFPTLTSAQYASMKKDDVYVIMFSQDGCPPCRQAKKTILPALVNKYASVSNVHVYLFPVDKDAPAPDGTHLNAQLGINGAPAFVVLYNDTPEFSEAGYTSSTDPAVVAKKQADLEQKIDSAVSRRK